MEKAIKLKMNEDRTISIFLNDEEKHKIAEERSISADEIYNILCYEQGDVFTLQQDNTTGIDKDVLDFFFGLFKDVIDRVNSLKAN